MTVACLFLGSFGLVMLDVASGDVLGDVEALSENPCAASCTGAGEDSSRMPMTLAM